MLNQIVIPDPQSLELIQKRLFNFEPLALKHRIPYLPLDQPEYGFALESLSDMGRPNNSIGFWMRKNLVQLNNDELWATFVATKKTACLDVESELGRFFLLLEEITLELIAKRLIDTRSIATRSVDRAIVMAYRQYQFLSSGYRKLCRVLNEPGFLIESCCGCPSKELVFTSRAIVFES